MRATPLSTAVQRAWAGAVWSGDRRTDGGLVKPSALMTRLNELLPVGSNVFVDSGNCVGWAMHYLRIDPPSRIFSALCMGAMGFAVGAVVSSACGAVRVSIAIVGDGAFLMHGAEVSTAARYRVGALWIVLNDNDLGMVSQGMAHFFPDEKGARADDYALGRPDLAGYARALGADAYDAHSLAQFGDALSTALVAADRGMPQVIVVHIDPTQVPPYYQHLEPPQHPSSASNQRSIR